MAYNISIVSDILEAVNFLSESGQCRVIKASLAFLYDEDYELDSAVESTAFKMLIPMLTEAKEKQAILTERNRANGKNGGRKKTQKTQSVILGLKETEKTDSVSKEDPLSSPSLSSPTPPSITPPIIPQENPPRPSRTCTHAHGESFDLKVGVLASEEGYIKRYQQEGLWADAAMSAKLTIPQVQQIFDEFVVEQKHNSSKHSDYPDFKRHFLNYLRVKAEILRKQANSNGNNRPDYSRRGRADVPTDISVDF